MIYYSNNYLAHHGILGQKWGKRNGPPYPLDAEDHSKAEKLAAGLKKSARLFKQLNRSENKYQRSGTEHSWNVYRQKSRKSIQQTEKNRDVVKTMMTEDGRNTISKLYNELYDAVDAVNEIERTKWEHRDDSDYTMSDPSFKEKYNAVYDKMERIANEYENACKQETNNIIKRIGSKQIKDVEDANRRKISDMVEELIEGIDFTPGEMYNNSRHQKKSMQILVPKGTL